MYKPEQERESFTVVDYLLSTYQMINRAYSASDLNDAHIKLYYARDDLAYTAARLASEDPRFGREILAAIQANPQFDFGEIPYLVEEILSAPPDEAEDPPVQSPPGSELGM